MDVTNLISKGKLLVQVISLLVLVLSNIYR